MKFQIKLISVLILAVFCLSFEIIAQKKGSTKPKAQPVKKSSLADNTFNEGAALFKQETIEGYRSALVKFNRALELYRNENDRQGEADCFMIIGRIYGRLKDSKQAFEYYSQAFDIYRSSKNNEGEAQAANNLGALARDLGDFETAAKYYQSALKLRLNLTPNVQAQILNGLGESLFALGKTDEAKAKFTEANTFWTASVKNEDKVRTTYNLGRISIAYNEVQQGLGYLNKALTESRQFDNPVLEGDILEELATYYNAIGDLTKAIEYRRRIFDAYTSAKASTVTVSRVLQSVNNLQVSYYRAGDFQNALQLLEAGIKRGQEAGETFSTAYLIGNKGVLLADQGKYQEAMNFLNQGITASRQAGNKFSEAYYLSSLAHIYSQTGNHQQAISLANQAVQLVPAGSIPESEGKVISTLIAAYAIAGDRNKTQETIQLASNRKLDVGMNAGVVQVLYAAGFAQMFFGNHEAGLKLLEQSFQIADKLNHEVEKARILYTASFGYEKRGDLQTAVQAAQKSHDFYKKIGNDLMDLNTHFQMGIYYYKLNQTQASADNFNSALDFARRLNLPQSQGKILYNLGFLYANTGNSQNAIEYFNQSLPFYENYGSGEEQKQVLTNIAEVYERAGDKKKAKEFRDKAKKVRN